MINKEKKIKQLDIVFENCEVCTLKPDMIYACIIDKIYSSMSINCLNNLHPIDTVDFTSFENIITKPFPSM